MHAINVFEEHLPGIGQRFDLELDDHQILSVVALHDGRRQIALRHGADDSPATLFEVDRDQAITTGAILLGARFTNETVADHGPHDDQVVVETVTIPAGASVIGRPPADILGSAGDDAVILAVIRDHTPEVIEMDPELHIHQGDRIAVAAPRSRQQTIHRALTAP
ncbi:hypothetical protein [Ilumatobacter sp.]|uniref:hypothetical protein n=1 Tax=Ilumatobacter sp. TaxID=1967498 RepID=UPI003C5929D0